MFRPPWLRQYRPEFNPNQNSQYRTHLGPRGFFGKNKYLCPRPPHISEKSNLEHWCETCDRGFPSAKLLGEHKLQHQKCNIDGCQFFAHPKLITKHIQMQHSSGLYNKISKLNNPEEIHKWREERKKNFPTRANIEKKAAELKEKIDRGEKMGLKQKQKFRDSKTDNKRKLDAHNNSKNDSKKKKICNENKEIVTKHKPINQRNAIKYLPPVEENTKITPFTGIQQLINHIQGENDADEINSNSLIEYDDNDVVIMDSKETSNACEPVLCGALVALMCQYGSSDEENNASNSIQDQKKLKVISNLKEKCYNIGKLDNNISAKASTSINNNTIINDDDNDSGPEEITVIKSIEQEGTKSTQKVSTTNVKKKPLDRNDYKQIFLRKQKSKLPSTLLQKLLFKEIRHERNMVLQCVRYIVKHNYFDN